jgi:hypothetical protein
MNFLLPTGLTIDTAKMADTAATQQTLGSFVAFDGSTALLGVMQYSTTTALVCRITLDDSGGSSLYNTTTSMNTNTNTPFTIANGCTVTARFEVPITDWAG